jgi:hypothetical protein
MGFPGAALRADAWYAARTGFRGPRVELRSPAAMLALLRNKSRRPDSVSLDLTWTCWVGAFYCCEGWGV